MDPQAAWQELLAAFAEQDWTRVQELADGLATWLHRGGFPPQVLTPPGLGAEGNRALAMAACKFAHQWAATQPPWHV
jgi:hypothetical protein